MECKKQNKTFDVFPLQQSLLNFNQFRQRLFKNESENFPIIQPTKNYVSTFEIDRNIEDKDDKYSVDFFF